MPVPSAEQAIANARKTVTNDVGMCLWYTQEWLRTPHLYPDATAQWNAAKKRHPGDRNPPAGAPVSWTGGSKGHGHSALSLGGGRIRTIDCTNPGRTTDTDIGWPERAWGLTYKGWHEDLGGVDLPYLIGASGGDGPTNPNKVKAGDEVWVVSGGVLNGRHAPGGDVIATKPSGTWFVVADVKDGWAQEVVDPRRTVDAGKAAVRATGFLLGADVSSHQANWPGLGSNEFYGWVKATEGRTYVNPEHDKQVKKIRDAGKVVGHYHWLKPGNILEQLEFFFSKANVQPGDMIALDWEDAGKPTCAEKDQWIKAAQDKVKGANKVGLYCNRDWWKNRDTTGFYGDYLWIAVYTNDADPGIIANWTFWQFSATPYDQNRGRFADLAALRAWAGVPETPPPPTPGGGAWFSTDYLFVQVQPNPGNPAKIVTGDRVKVTADGGIKARQLPGGPQSLDKDGKVIVREKGYEFTVTGPLVDGWASGGTNWYSSDYLTKVTATTPPVTPPTKPPVTPPTKPPVTPPTKPPAKPGWSAKPTVILDDLTPDPKRNVSYFQDVAKVLAVDATDGTHYDECYVVAQDYLNKGDATRFGVFNSKGQYLENYMVVRNGGHGSTYHAYRSAGGNLYIWTLIGSVAYRILWQPGKTITASSPDVFKADYKGRRPVGAYEPYVGFRGATASKETLSIHNRFAFTDGSVSTAPLKQVTIPKRTNYTQQCLSVSLDRIYRLMGSTNGNPPHGTRLHILDVFDWNGKLLLDRFDITAMCIPTTSDEPEGLTFTGTPGSLMIGKREGSTDPKKRSYPIWTMTGLP